MTPQATILAVVAAEEAVSDVAEMGQGYPQGLIQTISIPVGAEYPVSCLQGYYASVSGTVYCTLFVFYSRFYLPSAQLLERPPVVKIVVSFRLPQRRRCVDRDRDIS